MILFDFPGKVQAIEVQSNDCYTILSKSGMLYTEDWSIKTSNNPYAPMVRRFDEDRVLIAATRCREGEKNAKIYHKERGLEYDFCLGDAIRNILVFERKIVVSYFDEGVMEGKEFSKEGLAIFHKKGKFLWGYNSNSDNKIWDCYDLVKTRPNKVYFSGYGKFVPSELDINLLNLEEIELPCSGIIDSISHFEGAFYWKSNNMITRFKRTNGKVEILTKLEKSDRRTLVKNHLLRVTHKGFEMTPLAE